jgi:hypothetical protein
MEEHQDSGWKRRLVHRPTGLGRADTGPTGATGTRRRRAAAGPMSTGLNGYAEGTPRHAKSPLRISRTDR